MAHYIPTDIHVTYQLQFRKCGHTACQTCRDGRGHGPYWYAYWREEGRLWSVYIGKNPPSDIAPPRLESALRRCALSHTVPDRLVATIDVLLPIAAQTWDEMREDDVSDPHDHIP